MLRAGVGALLLAGAVALPVQAAIVRCTAALAPDSPADGALRLQCPPGTAPTSDGPLIVRLAVPAAAGPAPVLLVRSSRFDRLAVLFRYADGSQTMAAVASGAFGRHWHVGNQIGFPARAGATLVSATLRIDRLQSRELLRIRFVAAERAERQFELVAALIGAALALLTLAALYNLGLAWAVRRAFFLWHGLWALSVVAWGLLWSQLALAVLPGLAGQLASRLTTALSCLAILFAAVSATRALRRSLSVRTRRAIEAIAATAFAIGLLATGRHADLAILAPILSIAVLITLASVATAAGVAWRRGQRDARDLLLAWAVPMLMLAATQIFEFRDGLFGGGPQIAVLFASALQTICLSAITSFRLNTLRLERDAAIAQGTALTELAERDPLTGLLNRRGFQARCEAAFAHLLEAPFGLLLIDVDKFKSVNDRFGHEAGDAVLVRLAQALRQLERSHLCYAGRLGGEEFVIGVSGLPSFALFQFAEHVRGALGALDHGRALGSGQVTVSIGVAQGVASGPFRTLYARADRALYEAKGAGRDRVVFPAFVMPPDGQLAFPLEDARVTPSLR